MIPTGPSPPALIKPMLATAGPLPTDPPAGAAGDGWDLELKWDGVRAVACLVGGQVRLLSRTGT